MFDEWVCSWIFGLDITEKKFFFVCVYVCVLVRR